MKLIKAYIGGFGNLKDTAIEFDGHFHAVCEKNGYGKTTLATFISAMLYGMDTAKTSDKFLKERAKFNPWNGGKFGGMLEISCKNRLYRIERSFSPKSEKDDTLVCYDITESVQTVSMLPCPGEYLLGISKKAFQSSLFFNESKEGFSSDLISRIVNSVDGINDTAAFDGALEQLSKQRKFYKADKGNSGKIHQLESEILDIEQTLEVCRNAKNRYAHLEAEAEQKRKEKNILTEKKERAEAFERFNSLHIVYENAVNQAKAEYENFSSHYPIMPDDESVLQAKRLFDAVKKCKNALETDNLDEDFRERFAKLKPIFESAPLNEAELNDAEEKLGEAERLEEKLNRTETDSEEYTVLSKRFSENYPDKEFIRNAEEKLEEYLFAKKEKEDFISSVEKKISQPVFLKKNIPAQVIAIAIGGGILLLAGLVILLAGLPFGPVFLITGAIIAALSGILIYTGNQKSEETVKSEGGKLENINRKYLKSRNDILSLFNRYGYLNGEPESLFALFKEDLKRYDTLCYTLQEEAKRKADASKRLSELKESLNLFFDRYPHLTQFDDKINLKTLRKEWTDYCYCTEIYEKEGKRISEASENLKEAYAELKALILPYGILFEEDDAEEAVESLAKLNEKKSGYQEALRKKTEEKDAFLQKNTAPPSPEDGYSSEELGHQIEVILNDFAKLRTELGKIEQDAKNCEIIEAECERKKEALEEAKQKYKILLYAGKCLKEAHDSLTARYAEPLLSAYKKYADTINKSLSENMHISLKDFAVSYERFGKLLPKENFNTGFCVLSDICMRLAIIDILYPEEESPFLLLDDPFAYLDDENVKNGLAALKALSEKTQILYFTCHSGRAPKNECRITQL